MSICCAFSFSLIIFVLFCFPWDGVGEACAGVVNFFFFGRLLPEKLGFSSFLHFLYVHGLHSFVCVSIAGDGPVPSRAAPDAR